MDLLQDWRRRTLGAAAGVVVAPAAIIGAAIAMGVGSGGLGGLGSIGQAISGPDVPVIDPVVERERRAAEESGRLLSRVNRRTGARATRPAVRAQRPSPGAGARSTTPTSPARTPATPQRRAPVQRPVSSGDPAPVAQAPAPAPASQPPAPAQTPEPAPPSPVRQVGDGVKQVTEPVPVAGRPAGQVVDLIVDTVDRLPTPLAP